MRLAVAPLRADGLLGAGLVRGDELTTRAVACSGLAALFGLPILLLASVVFSAPLAAPAAIALGYLAMSYALAFDHPRSAAVINSLVLVGLVVWSLALLLLGEGPSRGVLAAALLAPAFAAAPALARLAIAPRTDRAWSVAWRNTACLDRLAPGEVVIVVRKDGSLLAATQAARASLSIPAEPTGDIGRHFALVDRPKLSDAIARCQLGAPPKEITLQDGNAAGYAAELSGGEGETVAIRLRPIESQSPVVPAASASERGGSSPALERSAPVCDVGEAAAFAMRHTEANARSRQVQLSSAIEGEVTARCGRQICRRILVRMIESALARSEPGDALRLTGRTMRGVVLMRCVLALVGSDRLTIPDLSGSEDVAALRELVEQAGGTLMVGGEADEMHISVRLDLVKSNCNGNEEGKR